MDKDKKHHSMSSSVSEHVVRRKTFSSVYLVFRHCPCPSLSIHSTTAIQVFAQITLSALLWALLQTGAAGLPMESFLAHKHPSCCLLPPQGDNLCHRHVKLPSYRNHLYMSCITGNAWQQSVALTAVCLTTTTNGTRSPPSQRLIPSQVAACAYICEMTHGYENEVFPSFPSFSLPEVPWPDPLHARQRSPGTISTGWENILVGICSLNTNRMVHAKERILTLWHISKLWMTSKGTGELQNI